MPAVKLAMWWMVTVAHDFCQNGISTTPLLYVNQPLKTLKEKNYQTLSKENNIKEIMHVIFSAEKLP